MAQLQAGSTVGGKAIVVTDDSRLSDARTPTSHNHAASEITSGVVGVDHLGTGTADANKALHGDGTWKDTEVVQLLTADVANSTTALATITNLGFTALANKTYLIEAFYNWDASAATVGIKASLYASGTVARMAGHFISDNVAGTPDSSSFNGSDVVTTTTGSSFTTGNMGVLRAVVTASTSDVTILPRFAAETTGTITMKPGTVFKYRLLN